eukprot:Seg128.14 transcript_id=Seg128.14/GoldUCD/mRNA.D3Y31 product="hypothetical protein" protein_id=Seg128.14/GoldUCD/D3Y31
MGVLKQVLCLTVCPQQSEKSRHAFTRSHTDKKYSSNNTQVVKVGSLVHCYQKCLAECLCYFANYKSTGSVFNICELVKYASCGVQTSVMLQDATGWIATKFGRIRGIQRDCCKVKDVKTSIDDYCKTYPGTIPLFDRNRVTTAYEWRCYGASSIQNYYYQSGSSYHSRNNELSSIINQHPEMKSATYVIGARGESCGAACAKQGKVCSSSLHMLNSVYLFHRLGITCRYNKDNKDCFSNDAHPVYYPDTGFCAGFINVPENYDCATGFAQNGRRLCKSDAACNRFTSGKMEFCYGLYSILQLLILQIFLAEGIEVNIKGIGIIEDKAKKKRRSHRGTTTKILNKLDDALKEEDANARLRQIQTDLKEKAQVLKELDEQIFDLMIEHSSEEDCDKETDETSEIKERVTYGLILLEDALKEDLGTGSSVASGSDQGQNLQGSQQLSRSASRESLNSNTSSNISAQICGRRVKLPKLELRKFSGKIAEWPEFWDGFRSAVHDDEELAKVDKFKYLRSYLEEPARSVVAGFPLTDADYDAAIKMLKDRFAKPSVIKRMHLNDLALLPPVYNEKNVHGLRNFHDQIETRFRALEAQGVDKETYSSAVVPTLMSKIPVPVRNNMIRFGVNHMEWNLDDMLAALKKELKSQVKKLEQSPDIFEKYNDIISQQVSEGIIEHVSELEPAGKIHYLPHRAVIRENAETTKVRIVYDTSCKDRKSGVSLNECLHVGPSPTPLIFDVLLRFRMNPVALVGDIEKAFLNIEIHPQDRDSLRFLWLKDIHAKDPEFIVYRFLRFLFGCNASPFLLNCVLRHHIRRYEEEDPEFVNTLIGGFFVDDLVTGCGDPQEALTLYEKAKRRMKEGGFALRKWKTNDGELAKEIAQRDGESVKKEANATEDPLYAQETLDEQSTGDGKGKVLGISWDNERDTLEFDLGKVGKEIGKTSQATKRGILSTLASLFDHHGLVSPVAVSAKILFQELCLEKLGRDDPLPEDKCVRWETWLKDLKCTNTISIPRCVVDESKELMSARVLATLMSTILEALGPNFKVDGVKYWLDRKTALLLIYNNGEWKQFVQHRVNEILRRTKKEDWGHVSGIENPADLGSRGVSASHLKDSKLWWEGPNLLQKGKDCWPSWLPLEDSPDVSNEKKKSAQVMLITKKDEKRMSNVVKLERHGSLARLLRVTAYVMRFVRNLKKKREGMQVNVIRLSAEEIEAGERLWIKDAQ